jgi:transcriptional regulator with XRE-family HTH domain
MELFGMWLAKEIEERGWSMDELSQRCDVNRDTILRVVGGARRPSSDLCTRIANAFEITWREVIVYACMLDRVPSETARLEEMKFLFTELSDEEQDMILTQIRALVERKRQKRLTDLEKLPPL